MSELALEEKPATSIVPVTAQSRDVVLMDREKFNAWYEKLRANAPANVDIATKKGRDVLRSYAADIRSEKASIDKARLRLTKEWRDLTAQANEAGKEIAEKLESLAVEVREPLTAWEEAEKARIATCEAMITSLRGVTTVELGESAASVRLRLGDVQSLDLNPAVLDEYMPQVKALQEQAISALSAAVERLEKAEREQAELEKLRAEAAERERQEQERKAAEEAEAEEARKAEERKAAQRQYAESIIEHIRQVGLGVIGGRTYSYPILLRELEEKIPPEIDETFGDLEAEARKVLAETLARVKEAFEQSQKRAQAEAEARQKEAAEKAAAEAARKAREEAEAEASGRLAELEAERSRLAAAEAAREAAEEQAAAEQAKRDADKKHRTTVKTAVKQAIMTCGASEDVAKAIVLSIVAGEIPHISIRF